MAPNRRLFARASRLGWRYGQGQPEIRKRRLVGAAQWSPLERPAPGHGNWKSVHKRFTRWAKTGIWRKSSRCCWMTRTTRYVMIDSTIVRAHQQAVCGKGGAKVRPWAAPGWTEHQIHLVPMPRAGRCASLSPAVRRRTFLSHTPADRPRGRSWSSLTRGMRATACWTLSGLREPRPSYAQVKPERTLGIRPGTL